MMWPFRPNPKQRKIAALDIAAAEARTKRYEKLFQIDTLAHANGFDEMVRRSLKLLEPKPPE